MTTISMFEWKDTTSAKFIESRFRDGQVRTVATDKRRKRL